MTSHIITWPAPTGEIPSSDYALTVNGEPVFVYQARVRAATLDREGCLISHLPDPPGERGPFALFDIDGPVTVAVQSYRSFTSARVLPSRAGIAVECVGETIRFSLEKPQHLTVILDEGDDTPLHLFISAPETDIPDPSDPSVIYFGPGTHEAHGLVIPSHTTVYLAGGAILRAVLPPDAQGEFNEKLRLTFHHGSVFTINEAQHVCIRGRGIVDLSAMPHPGWTAIVVDHAEHVHLSGVTLRDSSNWNVIINHSHDITVDDLRIVSGRLNSDGINSVNAHHVWIRRCFVRNHDDSIVVKTIAPEEACCNILVEDCVIWDDWGFPIGATYETRARIHGITYRRCDILFTLHQYIGIRVNDSATVCDITFSDIRIEQFSCAPHSPCLLGFSIVADENWGTDSDRGRIRDIVVEDVEVIGAIMPHSYLLGYSAEADIRGIFIRNVHLSGQAPATDAATLNLYTNEFVREVTITP